MPLSDKPLTRSELEAITQKLNDKERQLKEQAEALQTKKEDLITLQRDIE